LDEVFSRAGVIRRVGCVLLLGLGVSLAARTRVQGVVKAYPAGGAAGGRASSCASVQFFYGKNAADNRRPHGREQSAPARAPINR
jgi:hypothetical protein